MKRLLAFVGFVIAVGLLSVNPVSAQSKLDHVVRGITSETPQNTSMRKAQHIGSVPGTINGLGMVEGKDVHYYRFTVTEPTFAEVSIHHISNYVEVGLLSERANEITKFRTDSDGVKIKKQLLLKGDYFLVLKAVQGKAITYKITVNGAAGS